MLTARLLTTCALACGLAGPALAQGTLQKVAESGVIRLGHRDASVPFSYLDGTKPIGFALDLCAKIVEAVKAQTKRADLRVELVPVTSQNRIPLVQNGTVDLECGSTTNNSVRRQQVEFSINTFYTGTRFLTKKGAGVAKIEDLKGKTLVTTTGTTNFQVLRKVISEKNLDINLSAAKDHADSMLTVELGRAVAFGMDDILLYGLVANARNPKDWVVVGEAIQVEPYALMLRKDDPAFKKVVDDTMLALVKSGEFETLYKKWFMVPIPPRQMSLDAPISDELRKHLASPSDKPAL
jgi:ABC-type amino acid transport substrate-binding protein